MAHTYEDILALFKKAQKAGNPKVQAAIEQYTADMVDESLVPHVRELIACMQEHASGLNERIRRNLDNGIAAMMDDPDIALPSHQKNLKSLLDMRDIANVSKTKSELIKPENLFLGFMMHKSFMSTCVNMLYDVNLMASRISGAASGFMQAADDCQEHTQQALSALADPLDEYITRQDHQGEETQNGERRAFLQKFTAAVDAEAGLNAELSLLTKLEDLSDKLGITLEKRRSSDSKISYGRDTKPAVISINLH